MFACNVDFGDQRKEELLIKFGKHVRAIRESKNISSAEMARRCFMDRGNYTRIESGQKDIQLSSLIRISMSLDITLGEFLQGYSYI